MKRVEHDVAGHDDDHTTAGQAADRRPPTAEPAPAKVGAALPPTFCGSLMAGSCVAASIAPREVRIRMSPQQRQDLSCVSERAAKRARRNRVDLHEWVRRLHDGHAGRNGASD